MEIRIGDGGEKERRRKKFFSYENENGRSGNSYDDVLRLVISTRRDSPAISCFIFLPLRLLPRGFYSVFLFSLRVILSIPENSKSSSLAMLRRRLAKDDVPVPPSDSSSNSSPVPEPDYKKYVPKPRSKRRNGLIFALGGIFGIFVALFFANQQEVISLDSLMDLNLDALIDVIPQGIVKDAREFSVRTLVYG